MESRTQAMLRDLGLTQKKYNLSFSTETFVSFARELTQKVLFLIHMQFKEDEIVQILQNMGLEQDILKLFEEFIQDVSEKNRKIYIATNKTTMIKMWYYQYILTGMDDDNRSHYPDLILFDFQKIEIDALVSEFRSKANEEARKIIDDTVDAVLSNDKFSFNPIFSKYYKSLGVGYSYLLVQRADPILGIPEQREIVNFEFDNKENFGSFLEKKEGEQRPAIIFISRLRRIIMGGQKVGKRFVPFFMADPQINKKVEDFLSFRLNKVIGEYFKRLRNPKAFSNQIVSRLLNFPPINLPLFKYIDWDFMPRDIFYDGACVMKKEIKNRKSVKIYSIQIHPLSSFLAFYQKDFYQLFIDQLFHHELVHLIQYRISDIYDGVLRNENFKKKYPKEFVIIKKLWQAQFGYMEEGFDPAKHRSLLGFVQSSGGHTMSFMKEMKKFKHCSRAMKIRGRVEALYNGFYKKLWGKEMEKGRWYLC